MWGMAEAFSKRPANVRDGRSVLQKTCQCEGWQKRSPEDSGCEGPADTLLILMPMTPIIDYYYFKLYSTTLHHYSSLIIAIPNYILLIMIIALAHRDWPLKVVNNHPTPPPCLFCDHNHLPHLTFSTAISHNFGRWWSRESGGASHADKWRPPFWRPTNGGRRSLPLPQTPPSTPTPYKI